MKFSYFLYFCLVTAAWVGGCRHCTDITNPECANYDPCYGKKPVSAGFDMYKISLDYMYPPAIREWIKDTALSIRGGIEFVAQDTAPDIQYTWYIGQDTFHTRRVYLDFNNEPTPFVAYIKLIVQATPRTSCFPTDNGKDTVTRRLFGIDKPFVEGKYHGYFNNNPQDTGHVIILFRHYQLDSTGTGVLYFKLMNSNCSLIDNSVFKFEYTLRTFKFHTVINPSCYNVRGLATIDSLNRNLLRIQGRYSPNIHSNLKDTASVPYSFVGTRLW